MEDGGGGRGPQEGLGTGVVVVGEVADLSLKLGDGGEGSASDGLQRDDMEPDLDLVEPEGVGGGEVEMVAGSGGQLALDAGVPVGAVVVDDEVDVEVQGHVGIELLEEAQKLLMAMARPALGEDWSPLPVRDRADSWYSVALATTTM